VKDPTVAGSLSLRNDAEPAGQSPEGKELFKWTALLVGPDDQLSKVKSVRYELHPSYQPNEVDGDASKKGFPLVGSGWGTFTLRATVTYEDGGTEVLQHELVFGAGGSPTTPTGTDASTGIKACDDLFAKLKVCFTQRPPIRGVESCRRRCESGRPATRTTS
jgi:hypothetical protein